MSGNSNPGWVLGQIPTAAQWNAEFALKQDYSPALDAVVSATPNAFMHKLTGTFTADGTLGVVPAGALIVGVSFAETAGHTVSVALGNAAGGSQVLTGTSVTASTTLGVAAGSFTLLAFAANQTIYVHSASWSSASVNVTLWYVQ